MQTTSALWNTILADPNHRAEIKITINNVDYGEDAIVSLKTSRNCFGTDGRTLGLAPSGEIDLAIREISANIPRMAQMIPWVRLTNGTQTSEWLQKGVFFIDTRETGADGILRIHGYDAMLKACAVQPYSSLSWPATDTDAVAEIASILGVSVDSRNAALMTQAYSIPMPSQYTMRETLENIAALYGGSFIMSETGELRLVCLWDVSTSATANTSAVGGSLRTFSLGRANPAITRVTFIVDEHTSYSAGLATPTSGYELTIPKCPYGTQSSVNWLRSKIRGRIYQPYAAGGVILDPAAELGDTVTIENVFTGVFCLTRNFDSLFAADLAAPEDEELDHEYPYTDGTDRRYERRMNNFESQLSIQAQEIAARVTETGGDAQSFGWSLTSSGFSLASGSREVLRVNSSGAYVYGEIVATSGTIGGCSIENGTLKIANANIDNINAEKITAGYLSVARLEAKSITGAKLADTTIASGKIADGAAINRVIGSGAVTYGKTGFTSTLDQVGTNKSNIETLYGYFTGAANFNSLNASVFYINNRRISTATVTINGTSYHLCSWSS